MSDAPTGAIPPPLPTLPPSVPMVGAAPQCLSCGYDLTATLGADKCPECGTPTDVPCSRCGYSLRGLPLTGVCPECGTPIEESTKGMWLRYSSPEYLAKLHRGVFLIVTGILCQVLMIFVGIAVAFAFGFAGAAAAAGVPAGLEFAMNLVGLVISAVILTGWWLFSEPDPRYTGRDDGATARKVVRITTIVSVGVALLNFAIQMASAIIAGTGGGAAASAQLGLLVILASLIGLIAWGVQYFASMRYLRWLAPRFPDSFIYERAKLLMWLGPVLYFVLICALGIGPLIALILYWNLLDHTRKQLKAIRVELGLIPG